MGNSAYRAFERLNPDASTGLYRSLLTNENLLHRNTRIKTGLRNREQQRLNLVAPYTNEVLEPQSTAHQTMLLLVEIPVSSPADVFAYIPFGGWDECPSPAELLPIAHYWWIRNRAILATIANQYIEFYTSAPVHAEADAAILAVEQSMVSPAMIKNISRGFVKLSEGLRNSSSWYMWWEEEQP